MTIQIDTPTFDVVTADIDASELAHAATWVVKHMKRRQPAPILETVNLSVSAGGVRLRATDYETWREASLGEIDGPIEQIQLAGRQLAALTRPLRGRASIAIHEDRLSLTMPGRVVTVPKAGEVSEWPLPPEYAATTEHSVAVAALKRAMTSIGTDDALPMLTHLLCENGYLLSTDRFMITREESPGLAMGVLVPRNALRLFTTGKGNVNLSESGQWVSVACEGQVVIAKAFDRDAYPKVDRLIRTSSAFDSGCAAAECDRKSLLNACGGESVLIRRDAAVGLSVSALVDRDVVSTSQVPADVDADFCQVLISAVRLTSALKGCSTDRVRLSVPESGTKPVLLRSGSTEHLMMPQRGPR
ncbi:DNA polymerase III subunit beta [Mycobacteroides abscessus subsp. abscessus]|uniref:DNA polymerase III subunit beta n=1 Tax=Mycobacteroides abscessus TaxID=36809 RepID=UPI000925EED2|nr:DNA polymerase III subunit beta [Mycobacteroides abscessus]SIH39362.1 DNA polymerase III subunit beta [Mycobacteroides abscessus subsp. abscessus]